MLGFLLQIDEDSRAYLSARVQPMSEENRFNDDSFYETDSIQDAIEHFNLYIKDEQFYVVTPESEALKSLLITKEEALPFRQALNSLITSMNDATAIQNTILFPLWTPGVKYTAGERIRYEGILYRVKQTHIAQEDWLPNIVTSLFTPIILETE